MDALQIFLAIGLPWVAGAVLVRGCWRGALEGVWAAIAGYGYVVGMLGVALLLRTMDAVGFPLAFEPVAVALAGLAAWGGWRSKGASWAAWGEGILSPGWRGQALWEKAVFLCLLAAVALRLAGLGLEAATSPLFGWDAWATWAPKARVFFELRRIAPFVEWSDWLGLKAGGAYTISAAHYPPTLPLVQTWICLALGRWDDSLIGVPWLFCAAALGLAFYGQARVWGARPLPAMTFAYFLLSLPLLDTQVAIPGNADLWMATVYGLAAFSFFHWLRAGDRGQGMLALGFLAACAFVKVPGVAWMLTFGPALLVARRSWRALPFILGLPLLALGAVLARGLPKGVLDLPYLGHYKVAFHPDVWTAFAESAFSLASWHLLFYVVAGVALVRFRVFRSSRVFASMAMLVLAGFALVASVYSFSQLAEFALDFTQVNRAALPIVPVLLFVTLAAWVEPAPGRP